MGMSPGCLTNFLKVIKIITGKKFVRKCAHSSGAFVNQKSAITTLIPQTLEHTNELVPIGSTVYFICVSSSCLKKHTVLE